MRNLLGLCVCFFVLACGRTLQAAPQSECQIPQPAPNWVCVEGGWVPPGHPLALPAPPAQSRPTVTPQSIGIGEQVAGVLDQFALHFPQVLYALTASANGAVVFQLTGEPGFELWVTTDPALSFEAWSQIVLGEPLPVSAGQTHLIAVADCCPWDRFIPVDNPFLPFVLTTFFEAGQVAEPELGVPPPAVIPAACESVRPGLDWVCVKGGWLPPGHPLLATPPIHPEISGPVPSTGCTTPDPFAGIPGMSGVCIGNNGWVPRGHPLGRGGG